MSDGNDDKAKGLLNNLGGKVKEAVGKVTGNEQAEAEGQGDQVRGNVQQTVGDAKNTVGDVKDKLTNNKS